MVGQPWCSSGPVIMKRILPALLMGGLLAACAGESPTSPSTPVGVTSVPTITITFDDAREGVYQYAYPILKRYGIKANIAVFTAIWMDSLSWPEHITIPQAKELDANGWSIVSHSVNHKDLSVLDTDSLQYELRTSKRMLDSLKFHGTNVFIVPYLVWNDNVVREIASVYTMSRCCTETWYSLDTISTLPEHRTDMTWYTLTGVDISNYADTLYDQTYNFATVNGRSNILSVLNDVVNNNKFIDIVIHNVTTSDTSEFRTIVELLDSDRFRPYIKTYAQVQK